MEFQNVEAKEKFLLIVFMSVHNILIETYQNWQTIFKKNETETTWWVV